MKPIWTNTLTKEQIAASEKTWYAGVDAREAAGAEVLRSKGIDPGFTTREHKAAEERLRESDADWKKQARKRLAEIEVATGVVEPSDPDAWLEAAKARCAVVEAELRASDAPFTH
jgi:hypothetical protein